LRLYAHHLAAYDRAIVSEAVKRIALRPRREGETAFPELGAVVDEVIAIRRQETRHRANTREREIAEKWFWTWVEDQVLMTGKTEQQILDEVRAPGYTNRKAREAA